MPFPIPTSFWPSAGFLGSGTFWNPSPAAFRRRRTLINRVTDSGGRLLPLAALHTHHILAVLTRQTGESPVGAARANRLSLLRFEPGLRADPGDVPVKFEARLEAEPGMPVSLWSQSFSLRSGMPGEVRVPLGVAAGTPVRLSLELAADGPAWGAW